MKHRVLVACEESQAVTIAFRNRGFEAFSCDLQDCSGGHPEWHIKGDVTKLLVPGDWSLIIAHPPCTYLSKVGAPHLFPGGVLNDARYKLGIEAADFFRMFYNIDWCRICIENPTPFHIFGLPPPTQAVEPHYFGHPYKKRTCLLLKGLPPLDPTCHIVGAVPTSKADWFQSGGKDRQKNRSKSFPGIAAAMAD